MAVTAASMLIGSVPSAGAEPPGSQCGINLEAPQIGLAARSLPPAISGVDAPWTQTAYAGNFDPCATLSAALVTVEGATGSSPDHALLFHYGEYVGTATSVAYPFTSFDATRSTDAMVVLDYKDGRNVCTACDGPRVAVRYQWKDDDVEMLDPAPPTPPG